MELARRSITVGLAAVLAAGAACDDTEPAKAASPAPTESTAPAAGKPGIGITSRFLEAQQMTACTQALSLQNAVTMSMVMNPGVCPKSVAALAKAGLIQREQKDPWDKAYSLACEGDNIVVRSSGPDGVLGTEDDLSVGGPDGFCEAAARDRKSPVSVTATPDPKE